MNAEKWARSSDVERMIAHVAEHADRRVLALALCTLAESIQQRPPVSDAIAAIRAWTAGGPVPALEQAWQLDARAEELAARGDDARHEQLASHLLATISLPHNARLAAATIASLLASELGGTHDEASALLSDRLRSLDVT